MQLFAVADCNNFYCSCERVFHPELVGKPVVVLSNNDGCVIARSEEAKKLGNAEERNRIKRQVREMVRSLIDFETCPKDLIIIVRKPYVNRAFSENKNDLEIALKKAII